MLKFAKKCLKGLVGMCMVFALTITAVVPAFAAEVPNTSAKVATVASDMKVTSGNMKLTDVPDNVLRVNGSLSGYRSVDMSGSGDGFFVVDVSGKWSAWAGCTLKTSGFSDNATIEVSVYYGNDKKFTKVLGPNTEAKNIAMFNVSPGGYTVKLHVKNNSNVGNLTVWFY